MKRMDKGMKESYYIHLEPISENTYIYGVLSVIDSTPFDYGINELSGKREDILDIIAKRIITINSKTLDRNIFNLKFSEIKDAKYMTHHIENDEFYKDYRVNVTPAVFLNDVDKISTIKTMVQHHVLNQRLFKNWKNNQKS